MGALLSGRGFSAPERREKRVKYKRFSTFGGGEGCLSASGGANCDCSDGSIRPGLGLTAEIADDYSSLVFLPDSFHAFPADAGGETRLLAINAQGRIYAFDGTEGEFVYLNHFFTLPVKAVNVYAADGSPRVAFCAGDGVWLYDGEDFTLASDETSAVACAFHERLFVASADAVHYSAPLDASDFSDSADEGGYVRLPSADGEIVSMQPLGEAVFLFRRRAILRLEAGGAARDFSVAMLGYEGGEILGVSDGASGEKILFLASDGLYAFDGKSAERICRDVPVLPGSGEVRFGRADGRRTVSYTDRSGTKRLLVLDGAAESAYFSSAPADALSQTELGLLCAANGAVRGIGAGGSLPQGEEYEFSAENTDFGVSGRKFWKVLRLTGEGGCRVETENGGEKRSFSLTFENGEAAVFPLLSGERFSLRLYLASASSAVTGAELVFLTYA